MNTQDMSVPPISRFPVPKLEDLPPDLRERIAKVQEKAGFVPNVFLVLAHRPEECRAFFLYHDALMLKEGALTKAEREMIVVATSTSSSPRTKFSSVSNAGSPPLACTRRRRLR